MLSDSFPPGIQLAARPGRPNFGSAHVKYGLTLSWAHSMMVTLPAGSRMTRDSMTENPKTTTIVVAAVDRLMVSEALDECRLASHIDFVEDVVQVPYLGTSDENRS